MTEVLKYGNTFSNKRELNHFEINAKEALLHYMEFLAFVMSSDVEVSHGWVQSAGEYLTVLKPFVGKLTDAELAKYFLLKLTTYQEITPEESTTFNALSGELRRGITIGPQGVPIGHWDQYFADSSDEEEAAIENEDQRQHPEEALEEAAIEHDQKEYYRS
jgi:hypothetical protein